MKTIFNFLVDKLIELKLDLLDAYLLRWVVNFIRSNVTPFIKNPQDKQKYYWIDRSKILEENKILQMDVQNISLRLNKLCGVFRIDGKRVKITDKVYPLKKMFIYSPEGRKSLFALTDAVKKLEYKPAREINYKNTCIKQKNAKTKENNKMRGVINATKDISEKTREILNDVLSKGIFKHRLNPEGTIASKTLLEIERIIFDLVSGTFEKKNKLDDEWMMRKGIDRGILDVIKNDWNELKEALLIAMEVYTKWQKRNGSFTRDMKTWLYNPRSKKSLFLMCYTQAISESNMFSVENAKKLMDEKSIKICKKKMKDINNGSMWLALYSVYKYIKNNWFAIIDYNYRYGVDWKFKDVSALFEKYLNFLSKCGVNGNAGYRSLTWKKFVEQCYRKLEIDLDPGEEALKSFSNRRLEIVNEISKHQKIGA